MAVLKPLTTMTKTLNKWIASILGGILLLLNFSACTDQNDIDFKYETTIGVTAANIFSSYSPIDAGDFDLEANNWDLNIDVLIYDETGSLQLREHFESKTLKETFQPSFSLAPGRYRVISIASFTQTDQDGKFVYWNIDDEENLNTLTITESDSYYPLVFETLGINMQMIEVSDKPIKINADIRPTTSLITVYMDDSQNLHYGLYDRYSAKCRMAVQYNIRELSSNSVVNFDNKGRVEFNTREQNSEYNFAISRPHDKLDAGKAPITVAYRALLPEQNKEFQWKIFNREDELVDAAFLLTGSYPVEGKTSSKIDLKSGSQYALAMILDIPQLLFMETGNGAFNYKDYVKNYMEEYELSLIDNMLKFGYDELLGLSADVVKTYMFSEPYDFSILEGKGCLAYYPHSPSNHFEQFVTGLYKDTSFEKLIRVTLNLSLPYKDEKTGKTYAQPLSNLLIDTLVDKLNSRYTPYTAIGGVYQWVNRETLETSNIGIVLDAADPGKCALTFMLINQTEDPNEDKTDYESLIFVHDWESFLGMTSEEATAILGSNFTHEVFYGSDNWYYSKYNKYISLLSLSAPESENINSVGLILSNRTDLMDSVVLEYLKSHFIDIGGGRFSDSNEYLSRSFFISYKDGMLIYSAL